jgi:hypothetical protein
MLKRVAEMKDMFGLLKEKLVLKSRITERKKKKIV